MKNYLLNLFLLLATGLSFAQEETVWKPASKESQAYHEYRLYMASPPYGLSKIRSILSKLTVEDGEEGDGTEKPTQATYLALTLREKFTYHMLHGETYAQICDAMPDIQDEHKKIFGQLPDMFGENHWADRQKQFLRANRDSVIAWIKTCATRDKRLGLNFKQAIVEINGRELIPFLIDLYKLQRKDYDILTVLMLLMENNEYNEFMVSASHKKLYGDKVNSYDAFLNFNIPNEELIIKRAMNFYNALSK